MAATCVCSLASSFCTDAIRLAACPTNPFRSIGAAADQPSTVCFAPRGNSAAVVPAVCQHGIRMRHARAAGSLAVRHGRSRRATGVAFSAAGSTLPDKTSELVDGERALSVGDVMTAGEIITAKVTTTVDQALEFLVENRITGMPVVDDEGRLIGVVSDYDLLALDNISGQPQASSTGLFPQANSTWKAFKEIQKMLIKTRGKTVGDVMTSSPVAVRPMTNLEDAARLLLDSRFRRLPVVDEQGKLVGIITRGNVIRAALAMKKSLEAQLEA